MRRKRRVIRAAFSVAGSLAFAGTFLTGCGGAPAPKLTVLGSQPKIVSSDAALLLSKLEPKQKNNPIKWLICDKQGAWPSRCDLELKDGNGLTCDISHLAGTAVYCAGRKEFQDSEGYASQIASNTISVENAGGKLGYLMLGMKQSGEKVACIVGRRTSGNTIESDGVLTVYGVGQTSASSLTLQALVSRSGNLQEIQVTDASKRIESMPYQTCVVRQDGSLVLSGHPHWPLLGDRDAMVDRASTNTLAPPAATSPATCQGTGLGAQVASVEGMTCDAASMMLVKLLEAGASQASLSVFMRGTHFGFTCPTFSSASGEQMTCHDSHGERFVWSYVSGD